MTDRKDKLLISVSRRTDIPAYFGEWFSSRLDRGWVDVRNPYNRTFRRVSLLPEDVLGFVFWSKNPGPFMPVLDRVLSLGLPVLYHVTVTGLSREVEAHIPDKKSVIRGIEQLANRLPPSAITWRFDPTLPRVEKGEGEIRERFSELSEKIAGKAGRVALSLLDPYRKIKKRMEGLTAWDREWSMESARRFYRWIEEETAFSGRAYWCTEPGLESRIPPACIDRDTLVEQGIPENQLARSATRPGCSCMQAIDIGAYDTCLGGCAYCYAVRSHENLSTLPE